MVGLFRVNQGFPRMTSHRVSGNTVNSWSSLKSLMTTFRGPTVWRCRDDEKPLAKVTCRVSDSRGVVMLFLCTKLSEMKSCVDPESISMVARRPLNFPSSRKRSFSSSLPEMITLLTWLRRCLGWNSRFSTDIACITGSSDSSTSWRLERRIADSETGASGVTASERTFFTGDLRLG